MNGAVKSVTDQMRSGLDAGVSSALAQAQGDMAKFAAIVKKEIAVSFLKDFNASRKDGAPELTQSAALNPKQ